MAHSRIGFRAQCSQASAFARRSMIALSVASAPAFADFGFSPPLSIPSGGGPIEVVAGDLDGDGDLDLAAVNHWDHTFRIIKRHANGNLVPAGLYTTTTYPQSIALADFDGDGDLDIAVVGEYGADDVFVHWNNGNAHFPSTTSHPVAGSPHSVTAADVNGDGLPDVIVANRLPSAVSVLISTGAQGGGGAGGSEFRPQVVYPLGAAPSQIITADLDGDGARDVLVACWGSSDVRILMNDGTGALGDPLLVPTDSSPRGVATGDFNHDGHVDLATANFTYGTVSVLMGRPATSTGLTAIQNSQVAFAPAVHLPVASYNLLSIVVEDFDRDGHEDLVVAHGWSTVHTLIGHGDGTFQAPLSHAAGSQPRGLASADMDEDGDLDLIVANFGNSMVSVLTNLTPAPPPR